MANLLNKNLTALQKHNPQAAAQIIQASPSTLLRIEQSRNNLPLPSIIRGGHTFPLHSRFNPLAEGEKLAQGEEPAGRQQITPKNQIGYLVSFGIGAAHHLGAIMKNPYFSGLLLIDSAPIIKAILAHLDLSHLLAEPRLKLLLNPTPQEIHSTLGQNYNPILHGRLATHILRPLWTKKESWLAQALNMVNQHIRDSSRDMATQNRLGYRWFRNTLSNLPLVAQQAALYSRPSPPNQAANPSSALIQTCLQNLGISLSPDTPIAAIIAAGPTLNTQIPTLESLKRRGATLISTDTALPLLKSRGIAPHIVISIDAQQASYHHFFDGLPDSTVLLLDMASPPILTRKTRKIIFFASSHPLSIYIHHFFLNLPRLDVSAGNVTQAALSLCRNLGMKEVHIFGADFCYPGGIPYAVNTYIPRYFHSHGERLHPAEQAFHRMVRFPGNNRQYKNGGWRICGGILEEYRKSFDKALEEATSQQGMRNVVHGDVWGDPRSPTGFTPRPVTAQAPLFPVNQASLPPFTRLPKVNHFMEHYMKELAELPEFKGQTEAYLANLPPRARQAWATVLPVCAALRPGQGAEAWNSARHWIIRRVSRILQA